MKSFQLFRATGEPVMAWMCGKCGQIHDRITQGDRRTGEHPEADDWAKFCADNCCNWKCKVCGEPSWAYSLQLCVKHRDEEYEKNRIAKEIDDFNKAEKLSPSSPTGCDLLYDPLSHIFFGSIEEMRSHYELHDIEQRPSYLWCTKKVEFFPDLAEYVEEQVSDNLHEDAGEQLDSAALKELDDFATKWWEENEVKSYEPDLARCVIVEWRKDE